MKAVEKFRTALAKRGVRVSDLILFGSHATGHAHEGSDIDLVVISDDFAGRGYWERIELLASAVYEIMAPIEAVAMTRQEWNRGDSIIATYAREGEPVFSEQQ